MTHRDGFPRLSARSAWRGDAGHRKPCATRRRNVAGVGAGRPGGLPSFGPEPSAHWAKKC